MRSLIAALCFTFVCSPALAAETNKEPSEAQKAQQQRMKDCNDRAKGKSGDDRKALMKNCLDG